MWNAHATDLLDLEVELHLLESRDWELGVGARARVSNCGSRLRGIKWQARRWGPLSLSVCLSTSCLQC
jgi:hypothetical protein